MPGYCFRTITKGRFVIIRQVLQHLSNREIISIVKKLASYQFIILTEHIPEGEFTPNIDIISGQGTRLKKQSGVVLTEAPFNFESKSATQWLKLKDSHCFILNRNVII